MYTHISHTLHPKQTNTHYYYHVGRVSPYLQKTSSLINIRPRKATPCIPPHDRFFLVLECFKHHRSMKNSQYTKSLGDRNLPPWIWHAASSKLLLIMPPFGFRDRRAIVTLCGLTGGATVPLLLSPPRLSTQMRSTEPLLLLFTALQ